MVMFLPMGIGREPWVLVERLLVPCLPGCWWAYWDETVRRASMVAYVRVGGFVAGSVGLVLFRLFRSILLGKYGSIVLCI